MRNILLCKQDISNTLKLELFLLSLNFTIYTHQI